MYKLVYLPIARSDIANTAWYVAHQLSNPAAAKKLTEKMFSRAELLTTSPFINPVYVPIKPLKFEYRKLLVGNFIMFYYASEKDKTVTIARVIYAKRDFEKLLD